MGTTSKRYSAEVRERAVRLVSEHRDQYGSQWAAIESIAGKIGCTSESLRRWVQQAERDEGKRAGLSTSDRERLKQLERENRELGYFDQAHFIRDFTALVGRSPVAYLRGSSP